MAASSRNDVGNLDRTDSPGEALVIVRMAGKNSVGPHARLPEYVVHFSSHLLAGAAGVTKCLMGSIGMVVNRQNKRPFETLEFRPHQHCVEKRKLHIGEIRLLTALAGYHTRSLECAAIECNDAKKWGLEGEIHSRLNLRSPHQTTCFR